MCGILIFFNILDSEKTTEDGIITQMRADWILPDDKKLEVTLKILNKNEHLTVSILTDLTLN